jgi:hypothetical protein
LPSPTPIVCNTSSFASRRAAVSIGSRSSLRWSARLAPRCQARWQRPWSE